MILESGTILLDDPHGVTGDPPAERIDVELFPRITLNIVDERVMHQPVGSG